MLRATAAAADAVRETEMGALRRLISYQAPFRYIDIHGVAAAMERDFETEVVRAAQNMGILSTKLCYLASTVAIFFFGRKKK